MAFRWKTFLTALVVGMVASFAYAQSDSVRGTSKNSAVEPDQKEWVRVDFGDYSISVPPGLSTEERCPGCIWFVGLPDGILLQASVSPPTSRPTEKTRQMKAFKEEFSTIDGRRVWFWSHQMEPTPNFRYKYVYGVNTDYPRRWSGSAGIEWSMDVQLLSVEDQSSLANAILRSIRFPAAKTMDKPATLSLS